MSDTFKLNGQTQQQICLFTFYFATGNKHASYLEITNLPTIVLNQKKRKIVAQYFFSKVAQRELNWEPIIAFHEGKHTYVHFNEMEGCKYQ